MKKKILILGSGGMLGHMVYNYLNTLNKYNIIDSSYPFKANKNSYLIDVTNKTEIEAFIVNSKPDITVNCIGILLKGSEEDPSNAIYLNSYFPHQLSKILRKTGGKLIHISTDCVFTGNKGSYVETDFKDARDTYGLSKALGEVENNHDLTLRTSIIGPELKENGEGLFNWFMLQKKEIKGYTNVFWSGVTTLVLAKCIDIAIEQNLTGLYHVTNNEKISKYELLQLINKFFRKGSINIIPDSTIVSNKSLVSIYNNSIFKVKTYEQMIKELCEYFLNNKKIYNQYF